MKKKTILVTGAAGFIGFHLTKRLLLLGYSVVGIDNLNHYYDVRLKKKRLEILKTSKDFTFLKMDIQNKHHLFQLFDQHSFSIVIHLAAQAGVRYSLENPYAYVDSNLIAFMNILEAVKRNPPEHFIFASSSSVYGANKKLPYSTNDFVDYPVSLYAATKKSNELLAFTYSHLYKIPTTGLRFFTVYGPWGRPDMAYYKFTEKMMNNETIEVYNYGDMKRDFTYIDDITEGIIHLLNSPPSPLELQQIASKAPYQIFNIGNNKPVKLMEFIQTLEKLIGKKAKINYLPMQPGDVKETYADIKDLQEISRFSPKTTINEGLKHFVDWYKTYRKHV